jgi:hypothetical protein
MVQQQLVDYIKSQLKVGVASDVIRNALTEAGWSTADIEDSLKNIESASGAALPPSTPIVVSDLVSNSKLDVMIPTQVTGKEEKKSLADKLTESKQKMPAQKFNKSLLLSIVLGVLAIGFAAAAVYFYLQNSGLQDKLIAATGTGLSADSKISALNSQVAELTNKNTDLSSQIASLTAANQELAGNLSLFVAAPGVSTSEVAVAFGGMLAGGGKVEYSITSTSGVKIFVSNSKDAKVDTALKPLLGNAVQISGTHTPGSQKVTVSGVNGAPLESASSSPTTPNP